VATPTFTLLGTGGLTDGVLDNADSGTNWTDIASTDPDISVEGAGAVSGIFRADGEQGYAQLSSAPADGTDKIVRGWIFTNNIAYMGDVSTSTGDPYKLLMWDGSSEELKPIFGADTYPGGWYNIIWDVNDFTTLNSSLIRRWGVEAGHAISAKNAINTWMDCFRYLDGYEMTGGSTSDPVTFADIAGVDNAAAYGVVSEVNTVFFGTGTVVFGATSTGSCVFDCDGEILVFTEQEIPAGLYSIGAVNAGTEVVMKNSVLRSGGLADNTRFTVNWGASGVDVEFFDNLVVRASTVTLYSAQVATGNTFDDCGQVLANGANVSGGTIKNYEGASDTAALIWDTGVSPSGKLDDMSFTKGAAATHAIEFTTAASTSLSLNDIAFVGYSTATGSTFATFYFTSTSTGDEYTVNLQGVTGPTSYRSLGAQVTVQQTVTYTIRVSPATSGVEIVVVSTDEATVYFRSTTPSTGVVSYPYNYTGDVSRKVQIVSVPYDNQTIAVTLGSLDAALPVALQDDSVYYNP
jgi:hypothetical protein